MDRRQFVANSALIGTALASTASPSAAEDSVPRRKFKLKYAPSFRHFRESAGPDLLAILEFAAAQGFNAWEDNNMKRRPVEEQVQIAQKMEELGIEMGVFVGARINWNEPTLTTGKPEHVDQFLDDIRSSVDVAKRVRAKWMTIVPGHVDLKQEMDYQTAHVVDALRRAAEILEPHGLVMVLEPLNWWANHAGAFLERIPQAYQICRAVDSPSCKILFDIYHQQISEGNLIPNIDKAWDEIAYFQIGDNPGRNEPGTGEINYRNVFAHIHSKGFEGILGMEHGKSQQGKEGEQALVDAYVAADAF